MGLRSQTSLASQMCNKLWIAALLATVLFAVPSLDAGVVTKVTSKLRPAAKVGQTIQRTFPNDAIRNRPDIQILVPQSDEDYLQVFGEVRNGRVAEEMRESSNKLGDLTVTYARSVDDLGRSLSRSRSEVSYIVAHSEDLGATIVLPNGTRVSLSDLEKVCRMAGRLCIVVSCHSRHLGLSRQIEYDHAIQATVAATRAFQSRHMRSQIIKSRSSLRSEPPPRRGLHEKDESKPEGPSTPAELAQYVSDELNRISARETASRANYTARSVDQALIVVAAASLQGSSGN